MDNLTLAEKLSKSSVTNKHFGGVFASDKIPMPPGVPVSFVVNTDPADKPGQHWLGLYVKSPSHIYYFDSYSFPPNENLRQYLTNFSKVIQNRTTFQSLESSVCGYYVMYFIYMASLGYSMYQIETNLKRQRNPDRYVVRFCNKFF